MVIGPATVGGIQAGAFKIGDTAGTIDNIIQCKLYRPGSVGFVSKSVSNSIFTSSILIHRRNLWFVKDVFIPFTPVDLCQLFTLISTIFN